MKNLFLTINLVFLGATSQAQILQAPQVPELGVSATHGVAESYEIGSAGENMVWDYSGFVPIQAVPYTIEPSTNSVYSDDFPYANWMIDNGSFESFYNFGPDYFELYGTAEQGTSYSFEEPEKYLPFPFPMNEPFENEMSYTITVQGIDYTRTSVINTVLDGYGSILHPTGIHFDNINRVRMNRSLEEVSSQGVVNYYSEVVMFFQDTLVMPLVQHTDALVTQGVEDIVIDTIFADSLNTVIDTLLIDTILPTVLYDYTIVEVLQSVAMGAEAAEAPDFALFPNPARDRLTMKWYLQPEAIEFRDATGRLVHTEYATQVLSSTQVDVSGWARGVYNVTAIVGEKQTTKQLIIQ
jgi:hypothetical protein